MPGGGMPGGSMMGGGMPGGMPGGGVMGGGMPGGGMPGESVGHLGQADSSPWPLVPPAPPGGYSPVVLAAPPGSSSSPLPQSPSVRQVAPGYSAAGAAQMLQYPSADQPMPRQRGEELREF